jgi:exosortase B
MEYPLDQIEVKRSVALEQRRWLPWLPVILGLAALYGPTLYDLFTTVWSSDEQGHGPIVLAIAIWLIWRRKGELFDGLPGSTQPVLGLVCIVLAAAFYFLGRTQDYMFFEAGSLVFMLAGVVLLMRGVTALKSIWFGLFFMLFMVPLPNSIVDLLTQPMKMAVSYVAESVLFALGYPIARSGVMLLIGPYQLLVADACAGLHTLFTLEALGLLYLNVVRHASAVRNVVLAILIVPISFVANVIRVITLTLITYYLGDEAGQGFLHGFAGMVLFMSALMLIIAADSVVRVGVRTAKT